MQALSSMRSVDRATGEVYAIAKRLPTCLQAFTMNRSGSTFRGPCMRTNTWTVKSMQAGRNRLMLRLVAGIALAAMLAVLIIAQAPPTRPTPPAREPNTAGFVSARELPDGTLPPINADGNFIIGPTHNPAGNDRARRCSPRHDLQRHDEFGRQPDLSRHRT